MARRRNRLLIGAVLSLVALLGVLALGTGTAGAAAVEYDLANTKGTIATCAPRQPILVTVNGGQQAGGVCYESGGDHLVIADFAQDGLSVGMLWTIDSGSYHRQGICRSTHGVNTVYECDKNFVENKPIIFQAATCDGSVKSCKYVSDWRNVSGSAKEYT